MKDIEQFSERLRAVASRLVADFVPSAPENYRRMVAIAADEILQVPLIPLIEVEAVAIAADLPLGDFPFIEGLVHYQKPQLVAEVEEFCRERVVAGADRVTAHLSQNLEPPFPDALGDSGTDAASFMMKAHAVEFDMLPVEQESSVRVEQSLADADGCFVYIEDPVVLHQRATHCVHVRVGDRP